jgi:hypothetical protein
MKNLTNNTNHIWSKIPIFSVTYSKRIPIYISIVGICICICICYLFYIRRNRLPIIGNDELYDDIRNDVTDNLITTSVIPPSDPKVILISLNNAIVGSATGASLD